MKLLFSAKAVLALIQVSTIHAGYDNCIGALHDEQFLKCALWYKKTCSFLEILFIKYFMFIFIFILDKNGNVPDTPGEERTAKRKICHNFFVIFGIITLAFVVVTCGGAILYNNYMPFEVYVNKVVGDLTYPVLRMWRLIVLPLHTYFDIQSYSMAECLINNPWFIPGMYI